MPHSKGNHGAVPTRRPSLVGGIWTLNYIKRSSRISGSSADTGLARVVFRGFPRSRHLRFFGVLPITTFRDGLNISGITAAKRSIWSNVNAILSDLIRFVSRAESLLRFAITSFQLVLVALTLNAIWFPCANLAMLRFMNG